MLSCIHETLCSSSGKPALIDGFPESKTFVVDPLPDSSKQDYPDEVPDSRSESELRHGHRIGRKQPTSSLSLTCSFVSTAQTTVQWFVRPTSGGGHPWTAIKPDQMINSTSLTLNFHLETQTSLLSEVNLWRFRSRLIIPQIPLWWDDEAERTSICGLDSVVKFIQRERMEAMYKCAATNDYGTTERESKISVICRFRLAVHFLIPFSYFLQALYRI